MAYTEQSAAKVQMGLLEDLEPLTHYYLYVSTTGQVIDTGRRRRRRHSAQFKAEAVGAC